MAILGLYLLGKSNASSSASPAEKLQGRDFYRFLGVFCSQISIINFILQYHSHSFTLVHTRVSHEYCQSYSYSSISS
jgi:hypothetical protein